MTETVDAVAGKITLRAFEAGSMSERVCGPGV